MTLESKLRPYASPSNVVALINRFRTRNLPEIVDSDFVRSCGFSDAVISRIILALRFLQLIDEYGTPTDTLRALARSPEEEFRSLLEQVIRNAYHVELLVVDPVQDTQLQILDAFRRYEPASQHKRMVMLFLQLCREAGMEVYDSPRQRQLQQKHVSKTPLLQSKQQRKGKRVSEKPRVIDTGFRESSSENSGKANQTMVELESGGQVIVSLSVDIFQLSERDRIFVLSIVDLIRNYKGDEEKKCDDEISDDAEGNNKEESAEGLSS